MRGSSLASQQPLEAVEEELEAELERVHPVVASRDDLLGHAVEVRELLGEPDLVVGERGAVAS